MWFSITCLPVPRAAGIACLWSWKPSTFSFSLNNYTLILNRKRETLNAGLVKTCLPASLLSQILQLLLSGKPTKTNPLQRVSQERNRTKLTKILGKRDNSGCSFTRQFHLSNHSLLPKWEILLLLHYLLFLLHVPTTFPLCVLAVSSTENYTSWWIATLDLLPGRCKKYTSRHKRRGGTTQLGVGSRNRVRGRADLPIQQSLPIMQAEFMKPESKEIQVISCRSAGECHR